MEEPKKPTKRKDQIRHDKEVAQRLQAQMQAELEEEDRLVRQREEEANIVSWDNVQAMIDADYQMAQQMQVEEQEKLNLQQESTKKQKVDDDKETTELKNIMEVMPNQEEVALDVIPLIVKSPSIVNWKIHKEGKKSYYQIIRVDGNSKIPVEDLDLVLYGDFKTMFEPHVEDNVWKNQSDYRVLDWKLYDSCGVHSLRKQNGRIFGIKRLLDDLGVTAAKLMLLVYKLLLLVFRVNAAGTKLQLLKD
ncbi:hypothetical protein Tco_0205557 [Tanacetum coccineum]